MDDDADAALFAAHLDAQQRAGVVPTEGPASLSHAMAQSNDPRMQALASHASGGRQGADVEFLLSLLTSTDAAVLEAATDALWKLGIAAQNRGALARLGGGRALLPLLTHADARVQRVAAGACAIFCLDASLRRALLDGGAAGSLAALLADAPERVAEQAARAAANVMAAAEADRAALVRAGVAGALAAMLRRARGATAVSAREAGCRALAEC